MMAPRNPFSACLRAPREIHISDSAAYFTGVAKNDRIGADRIDLLNRGDAIPLGLGHSLSRYPTKLRKLIMRVERLNKNQRAIIKTLLKKDEVTVAEMVGRLKVTPQAVRKDMAKLQEMNLVAKMGSGRSTYYVLKETDR
jgi:DNA-binding transcriptional ArsR family regulator